MSDSIVPPLASPPCSEQELMHKAMQLGGQTVLEVARSLQVEIPDQPKRHKGFVGKLVERALGADAANRPVPDFMDLDIELKTLPVSATGRPVETTYVCRLELSGHPHEEWVNSRVYHKLKRVLFLLIEGDSSIPMHKRRFGISFLWSPSPEEETLLKADWEDIMDLRARGLLDAISARRGRVLQLRPKAANRHARGVSRDHDDEEYVTSPRGFYLRTTFTASLIQSHLAQTREP